MSQSFKTAVKTKLIQAATNYSKLLNVEIIVASKSFDNANTYIIRFFRTNFLHLTGVFTNLTPEVFLKSALMVHS